MTRSRFGLPILSRELFELAARRRTFIQRTLFATCFLTLVYLGQLDRLRHVGSGLFDVLGTGQWLFSDLVGWQIGAVVLVMPLITCGAIVNEKQRDTLTLLLTSRTTPFGIIIQKLLSRVCLMLTLLFMSMPLAAFAYSLGGIELNDIIGQVVGVVVLSFVLGSLTIMWSVTCSSAAGAFIATMLSSIPLALPAACLIGVASMEPLGFLALPVFGAMPCMFFLAIASDRLRESALKPPKNHVAVFFRALDQTFDEVNRMTGGVRLAKQRSTLPNMEPITWRETEKKSLGQPQHLIRMILMLEVPTVLILAVVLIGNRRADSSSLTFLVALLWAVSIGLIIVRTSGLLAAERTRQTLEVLLTTPLSGREILTQFAAGSRRLMLALTIPFVTVVLARAVVIGSLTLVAAYCAVLTVALVILRGMKSAPVRSRLSQYSPVMRYVAVAAAIAVLTIILGRVAVHGLVSPTSLYAVSSILAVLVFMPLCGWITLLIGLLVRTQMWALLATTLLVCAWCFVPEIGQWRGPFLLFVSPSALVLGLEQIVARGSMGDPEEAVYLVSGCLSYYAAVLVGVRSWCLAMADRRFGRCEAGPSTGTR